MPRNVEQTQINVEKLDKNMGIKEIQDNKMVWYDPKESPFQINGFAWLQEEKIYRRLPKQPKYEIPEQVDILANCTAGGQIRFQTNAVKLAIKVKLQGKANMNHMPATGQCGFDCYIGEPGKQQFCSVTKYDHTQDHFEVALFERNENDLINVTLHFPLYQGVEEVWIGMNHQASIQAPPEYDNDKKLIFYGTSILQGGCASRPGMAYTNILSRRINQEFINLGFSGNGKGEANLARLISEINDPACLVLDYEPNCVSTQLYKETLPKFIEIYREVHPEVPILVISKFPYSQEIVNHDLYRERMDRLEFQKQLIQKSQESGDEKIYFYEGTHLLGSHWDEKTVDGVHPTDLGFMSMADQLTSVIEKILQ
ncbi:SGNH/GDSL hydrolase family protein [Bacillus niameyensis]|uniref:SGNH/GDSL hydrolase family protein n=1 Tax=Bacillus niameyensis TaxID=1522308 RepID=UPI000A4C7803|nr:SGNH/GDSL hydrolase family protein [Bacillus niameyensis]